MKKEVILHGFSRCTVESYVRYLYTNNCDITDGTTHELYGDDDAKRVALASLLTMAHRYDTHGLVTLCEIEIAKYIDMDNIVESAHLTDTYHAAYLHAKCVAYIDLYIHAVTAKYPALFKELPASTVADVAAILAKKSF